MLIIAIEGQGYRYEVLEQNDGYTVQPRDLDTDEVDEDGRMFRTAAVAFAYAEAQAMLDRLAAARLDDDNAEQWAAEYDHLEAHYQALSTRLADEGVERRLLSAWADARARRVLH
jgi:hypothetical protein